MNQSVGTVVVKKTEDDFYFNASGVVAIFAVVTFMLVIAFIGLKLIDKKWPGLKHRVKHKIKTLTRRKK